MSEQIIPAIGTTIKARQIRGAEHYEGMHGVVTDIPTEYAGKLISVEFPSLVEGQGVCSLLVSEWDIVTTDALLVRVAAFEAEVAHLKSVLEREQGRVREAQNHYYDDMSSINDIMREVKGEQSWCDDGYNGVVDRVNTALVGGYEFPEFRGLVKKWVTVRGETTVDVDVWVHEGDDENDSDYWMDEDGDEISDPDEFMQEALIAEFNRMSSRFDDVEVQ